MKEQPKISIIVAVYNTEKYLPKCLDSILSQTLKELEIILIDDGSTDKSREICDEYAQKDQRVKVIHKKNAGMGVAYNTGIDMAQGEYIGFVETDDWIEPSMYEELYQIAKDKKIDVVKSLYTMVYEKQPQKLINKFSKSLYTNSIIYDSTLIPEFYMGHVSHWSAIYRRELLDKKIRFNTTPGAASQDIGFGWQVFTQMKSCYILPKSFYNYFQNNINSSSLQGYKTATNSITEHLWINQLINTNNYPIEFVEIEAKTAYGSFLHHYNTNCNNIEKIKYLIKGSKLFKSYLKTIKFTNFKPEEKKQFKLIAKHPFLFYFKTVIYKKEITLNKKKISFLGLNIKSQKNSLNKKTKKLLGIPYYKQINKNGQIKKYLCGIQYKVSQDYQYIKNIITKLNKPTTINSVNLLKTCSHALSIAETHKATFSKYKNINNNKDIALIATGPTLNQFTPLRNCLYVGVNKAVCYDKIHFDYLFFQDADFPHNTFKEIMNSYPNAKKFYGLLQEEIKTSWIVSESDSIKANAERYYVISQWKYPPIHFPYDISSEPLGCNGSVSFAAMQFILWTNPKRIFLIGQDCTTQYWDNSLSLNQTGHTKNFIKGWIEMKKFASLYYPDTEIISINPVGLRGLFTDVYTEEYLQEHTEIDKALVKILQKDGEIK